MFYNFITGFAALEGLNKMRHINKKLLSTVNISLTTSYSFFNPKLSLFLESIANTFFFWGFCSFSCIKGTERMSEEGVKF